MTNFFLQTIPPATAKLTALLQSKNPPFLSTFYLSGGTALSLQLGHRESEDLDFFSPTSFDPTSLQTQLEGIGKLEQVELADNTLNAYLDGVKLQFLGYPYPLLKPLVLWDNFQLSSILDIACTKLQTVMMRGSKKDFIDLYFILEQSPLPDLFQSLKSKYPQTNYNLAAILKSLVYFTDAESQPMPRMHKNADWETVKSTLVREVKSLDFTTLP
jgi:hypothetical protein